MKTKTYQSKWRSDKAEQNYRKLEAAGWEAATDTPPEAIDVPTSFGPTRAYRWAGEGPAVVFLHGMGDTSIRWLPFAEQLGDRDVYAIDIMGDVGQSVHEVGFTSAADYAVWLDETLDGLGLDKPHVVGHSLGGYIALLYAMTSEGGESERAASTVAFDPVGVVDLRMIRFMAWGMAAGLSSFGPAPFRQMMACRLKHPLVLDKAGMRLVVKGQMGRPPKLPPLPVFTDDQLGAIKGPLHLVTGTGSTIFDVKRMVERTKTHVAKAETHLLDGAGHALTMTHFDECLRIIRSVTAITTAESNH